ncbi:hypothetical protein VNO78_18366 [Psophocarpus tetragonolobus]|uniref:Secreted protein n=1 Tax=Psophocarpus tetragonolobus TaxID=3891 RepID=A0AAN9XLY4_PSOTE
MLFIKKHPSTLQLCVLCVSLITHPSAHSAHCFLCDELRPNCGELSISRFGFDSINIARDFKVFGIAISGECGVVCEGALYVPFLRRGGPLF